MMLIKTKMGYAFNRAYFDIDKIMNSGQLALIYKLDNVKYLCISEQNYCIIYMNKTNTYINTDNLEYWLNYFDFGFDYKGVCNSVDISDNFLYKATKYSQGIRILNRNLWEVMVAFILSQNNNIPNIMNMIRKLCKSYGNRIYKSYYSFPTFYQLRNCKLSDLQKLGFGYRAEYVYNLIQIANSNINLEKQFGTYERLLKLKGIGPKVANCIDLYGNHNYESFPIDIHIQDILDREYDGGSNFDWDLKYKGIYQMYMFYYELNNKKRGK